MDGERGKALTTLAIAIERQQWELAAVCLLLGVTRAAAALPPEAVEGLVEVLGEARHRRPAPAREVSRARRGRRP